VRKAIFGAVVLAAWLAGLALAVKAQGPPGGFGRRGPGAGGPMTGMFEFGGLLGGFGGKVVTGKPIQATFTMTHTETMPGNTITNTTTGTFARGADGSTYRDVKLAGMGPWAASGKAEEFIYIRNVTKGTQYIVNVTKGTYRAFPIGEHDPKHAGGNGGPGRKHSNNETVDDNPNGTYTDPVSKIVYPADDRKMLWNIPAGAIGNTNAITVNSERVYSTALDVLLMNTRSDPRFGTTTYQLSGIGQSPASSLFTPDPSFTQVQGGGPGKGRRGNGQLTPPAPQN
jgi:hypothetical protein